MARLALLLATVAVLLAPAATALAQDGGAALSPVDDDDAFPERSWVLTLPEGESARPNQVSLRENEQAVRDLDVVPADAAQFGVVLDASKSMQGWPIEDAMEAARAFAARRPDGQALGVVTQVQTVLRPTTDGGRIAAALSGPPALAPDTSAWSREPSRPARSRRWPSAAAGPIPSRARAGRCAASSTTWAPAWRASC